MSYRGLGSVIRFATALSLRALAKNPLAHIRRALNQFNALIFATNQETNRHEVHQSDFAQVQHFTVAATTHCRLNRGDMVRLNPTAQPQSGHTSMAILFNP